MASGEPQAPISQKPSSRDAEPPSHTRSQERQDDASHQVVEEGLVAVVRRFRSEKQGREKGGPVATSSKFISSSSSNVSWNTDTFYQRFAQELVVCLLAGHPEFC